jgi:hypothetical protein
MSFVEQMYSSSKIKNVKKVYDEHTVYNFGHKGIAR